MTNRIDELIKMLHSDRPEILREFPSRMRGLQYPTHVEKSELFKALTDTFLRLQKSDSLPMLKVAILTEAELVRFGADIAPLLVQEISEVDGDSATYLGKTLAKIGKPALDTLLSAWHHFAVNEHARINLLQTLSYFPLAEATSALPRIIQSAKSPNHQVKAMALHVMARLVEKCPPLQIDAQTKNAFFDIAYLLRCDTEPLVRKNALRVLGQLVRKNALLPAQKEHLHAKFLEITGKDERHSWDRAFIVRKEAEHFLHYFTKSGSAGLNYHQTFRILSKEQLCLNTIHFTIEAPFIARKIEAGQFIIIRPHVNSERIPLSICGWDRAKGTLDIIVSAVGRTSHEINWMNPGDAFKDVVGPLGERSMLPKAKGTCVVIGGGYGTGAILPTASDMKRQGNKVIGIVGARSKEMLILQEELRQVCDEVIVTTNDGSAGRQGMVTDALREILPRENVVHVLAVGPVPMMKAVSELTRPIQIETYVSLNAIMVDGTGMCGACRVMVGGETKFACFHGPDFDGHLVDFENLMKRQKMFVKEEKIALDALLTPYYSKE